MGIGPVQLLAVGFVQPRRYEVILDELDRLRKSDLVRVIDALAVYKDADGTVEVEHLSNMSPDEAAEFGGQVGDMIAPVVGRSSAEAPGGVPAEATGGRIHLLGEAQERAVIGGLSSGSAAALILIEHHWAVPLRDAVIKAGGTSVHDEFLAPVDVVDIGMRSLQEAAGVSRPSSGFVERWTVPPG